RAGGVRLHPGIAKIAVLLVGEHQLLVHHRSDARRQTVQHEGGGEILGDGEGGGRLVGRLDQVLHVVRRPAELRQDEGGRLVQDDHPLQRERHVLGGEGVAGLEFDAGTDLERDGFAVIAHAVAFGDVGDQRLGVFRFEGENPVIDVGDHLAAAELENFGGIEGDDVVDLLGDHQGVSWRFRLDGTGYGGGRKCYRRNNPNAQFLHVSASQFASTGFGWLTSWISGYGEVNRLDLAPS